jgi:peptide chain release factor 1
MIDQAYIEKVLGRLPALEQEMSEPGAAADQKRYRKLVTEHGTLSKLRTLADAYTRALTDIRDNRELAGSEEAGPELREMAAMELEELEARLPSVEQDLRVGLLPPDPNEARHAIVEIRAGTGGDEAALFAGDLFRMYTRYAESRGWKIAPIDVSANELGGYKDITFAVEGVGAYGILQYESGGQRVQRVPVTESQGRIHTSAATVAVFPEADDDDELEIKPEDVRVDAFRASGPGGQSVNTTDSAIRLTHLPTGLIVQCQDQKSQHRNKEKAMSVLKSRILDRMRQEEQERMGAARRKLIGSGDRSERVRTYNFPQNRLTDHRINLTLYSLDRIIEGELGAVIEALRSHDAELRLNDELAAMDTGS